MNIMKNSTYEERHRQMLTYQQTVKPIPPLRDLEEVWGLASTSAVAYVLKKMMGRGMVKELPKGKYRQYVAVEVKDE